LKSLLGLGSRKSWRRKGRK